MSFTSNVSRRPSPEWGAMITEGATNFYQWWIAASPGLAILLVVLSCNFVGDGLRDTFDVKDIHR
jgi:peptide/nickel transport system permease protein